MIQGSVAVRYTNKLSPLVMTQPFVVHLLGKTSSITPRRRINPLTLHYDTNTPETIYISGELIDTVDNDNETVVTLGVQCMDTPDRVFTLDQYIVLVLPYDKNMRQLRIPEMIKEIIESELFRSFIAQSDQVILDKKSKSIIMTELSPSLDSVLIQVID